MYKKAAGQEAKLCYLGHTLVENRNGLIAAAMTTQADGMAERDAALLMLHELTRNTNKKITAGADKAYDTRAGSDATCGAEKVWSHRRTDKPTHGIRGEFKQTLAGGETVWIVEADWADEESETKGTGEGGLAVRIQLRVFQPNPHAETAGAERVKERHFDGTFRRQSAVGEG